ncbi:MAG: aminotransferase class V-fold PLP-dependent enzyme, partial [Acidobacteria bacterium]|nr:aminotransferase class V-fold PLP-dependent enzyme [Acidobacteriota bacterium]
MLSDNEVLAIRARFPIFRQAIYLNSCSQGALSDSVEKSMLELLEVWNRQGSPWDLWIEQYEIARKEFAELIGADADEVAIVPSVSAGISSVATALDFSSRKRVLMGEFEFPTMGHVWMAQQRRGANISFLQSEAGRIPAKKYAENINHETAIVPVTGVCFSNGFRSEIEEIVAAAHDKGAYVLLDDYQDCGTRPRDVKSLDLDFYTSGNLKYLLGAAGVAFLYVRRSLIEVLRPAVSGWFAQQSPFDFATQRFEPATSARRFESGTPPIPSIYLGLAGVRLLKEIGLANVAEHVKRLTKELRRGADELGIAIKTPSDSVGPLTVLKCKNVSAMIDHLGRANVICSSRHDGLRIALHVYNTLDDVKVVLR